MKLLSALDLARSTPSVLRETILWARRLSAELVLLHVAPPDPDFIGHGAGPESSRLASTYKTQRAGEQLESLAIELRKDGIRTEALLVQGDVAAMILQEAKRLHIDAIIMGTHARAVTSGPYVGSITRHVLHLAARPVILIPPPAVL
ncbi:MAG: universal stress protein [Kiritimatiellia bacterium]|jgi:nucleotide-binding universal stress UspA family protein|nr:universal stress protein [Kiritimatiellia bacterium]